jgi:hypothetical protein
MIEWERGALLEPVHEGDLVLSGKDVSKGITQCGRRRAMPSARIGKKDENAPR